MSNYTSKHSVDKTRSGKSADAKKKKVLIIVIVAVLAVIIAAALIFIFVPGAESGVSGFFGGKPAYVPETQDGTTIITPYYENGILPSAADRHDVDVIKGGGANGSDLLGKWQMGDHDTYLFDYALLYVVTLEEYLQETGDTEALDDLYDVAMQQVEYALRQLNSSGVVREETVKDCFVNQ